MQGFAHTVGQGPTRWPETNQHSAPLFVDAFEQVSKLNPDCRDLLPGRHSRSAEKFITNISAFDEAPCVSPLLV
jgi:hypothetical protein